MSGTATTVQPASDNEIFLKYAGDRPIAIYGTLPLNTAGGSSANVTWQSLPPETPVWVESVDFLVSWKINVTVPSTQGFTVSPFAPYSAFSQQFTIAGAPPWPLTEMTPWLLDNNAVTRNWDGGYLGIGQNAGYLTNIVDTGPYAQNFDAAAVAPGAAYTNSGTTSATVTLSWTFPLHVQLQQKRTDLWGMVPLGDPKNRLATNLQLNPIVGTTPEQNLLVSAGAGVTAATDNSTVSSVLAIYNVRDIDILPGNTKTPNPTVGLGLTLNATSIPITSAGTIYPFQHVDAMVYTAIHHLLVNNQAVIRPDYMGLWLTQEQKSARHDYDSQANTLGAYWERFRRRYHRYPYKGQYSEIFDRGVFPDIPSLDPYEALMSPDDTYAALARVKATPAMQTAMRIASGTSLTSAYVRIYEKGLVKVAY